MSSKREQVWVGTLVLVAVAILIGVTVAVSGAFRAEGAPYKTYFRYAAGLKAGVPVRYGGLEAGRIDGLKVDPKDSTRIEVGFHVSPGIPVKTDSIAKISSVGALGEPYLEITTGSQGAQPAPPGSTLKSKETVSVTDIGDQIASLTPTADEALRNLNARLAELQPILASANELLNERNRKNIGEALANLNGILAENRQKISESLDNVQAATKKLPPLMDDVQAAAKKAMPLLDDLKAAVKEANDVLVHLDAVVVDNRDDLRATITEARKTLDGVSDLVKTLQRSVQRNEGNVDEIIANVTAATENVQQLTEALKRNPSLVLRGETAKDRKPGDKK